MEARQIHILYSLGDVQSCQDVTQPLCMVGTYSTCIVGLVESLKSFVPNRLDHVQP